MTLLKRIWNDEAGFIVSTELILIATIVVIGLIVGLTAVRDAVTSELSDVAGAVQEMDQSYRFYSVIGHSAAVSGSGFADAKDYCDDSEDPAGGIDNCITIVAGNNTNEQGVFPQPSL